MAYARQGADLEEVARRDMSEICSDWSSDALIDRFDQQAVKQDRELIDRMMLLFSQELGPIVEIESCEQTRAFVGTSGRTGTLVGSVEFERAMGEVTILYVREGEEWKIRSFDVSSVALQDAMLPKSD
jgi:hypothetical protein